MRLIRWSTVVAAGVVLACPVLAEEPDCLEILKKVDATAKALKAVTYEGASWMEDTDGKPGPQRTRGKITLKRGDDHPLMVIDAKVGGDDGGRVTVIVGEKDAAVLNHADKTYRQGDDTDGTRFAGAFEGLIMQEYAHPRPFGDEIEADARKYEGKKSIAGVECHVIHVTYKGGLGVSRWYFGVEDNLPHRVDRITPGRGQRVTEVSELNTSPKLDDKTFAINIPEGYTKQKSTTPAAAKAESGLIKAGEPAPAWSLQSPDGKTVSLSDLKGKIVILDFWATWCGPCKRAMPTVQKIHETFKDKGVVVYGISTWERDGDPAAYMKSKEFTYGLLVKGDDVATAYKVQGIPTFYIIGPDGKVLFSESGFSEGESEKKVTEVLNAALAKKE